MLRGFLPGTEVRERRPEGKFSVTHASSVSAESGPGVYPGESLGHRRDARQRGKLLQIYPYALSRERLERAIVDLGVPAAVTTDLTEADVLLTLKSHAKRQSQKLREARGKNIEVHIVRSNTLTQMENFLREVFGVVVFEARY